ncbi:MAG TPA: periplasmic heavy metal sensor [Methylomirabilota bacterium]|nr:periplasmic heavy metal sensor [Methylomirabilota bacterium]
MSRVKKPAVWSIMLGLSLIAVCLVPSNALAQAPSHGRGWRGGWGDGLMLPALLRSANLTPEQQSKIESILSARRTSARAIIQQLRQAQEELGDKLLAPGQVGAADIQPQLQRINQLREQLLQNSAQATLDIRAILTPDQLSKAGQVKDKLRQLRAEMHQLLSPGQP